MSSSELRFLVDVGIGKGIEKYLRDIGHDAKAVRDIDSRMKDLDIIRLAASEDRIVITMDKDFGESVYFRTTNSESEKSNCNRMSPRGSLTFLGGKTGRIKKSLVLQNT